MEPNSAAEELPALYRAVLDRVAELEAGGRRDLANQVRADAIRIYSRSWDDRAWRELQTLLRHNSAGAVGRRFSGRTFRRRVVRTA